MRRIDGLRDLRREYDSLLCDVWGVLHNGITAYPAAGEALVRFRAEGGSVVLVTNSPRRQDSVAGQLHGLGVPDAAYDAIVSSGDVTRELVAARPGAAIFHLGPDRDLPFYEDLPVRLVGEREAELVSCTGLFDDTRETSEDYRPLLRRLADRNLDMVCANPDLVVERGGDLIPCAGALAVIYREFGGRVAYAGKPYRPIYELARRKVADLGGRRSLAIGDGLPTDVRGGVDNGFDVLFVTGGIHAADFGPPGAPEVSRVASRLAAEGLRAVACIPALVWDSERS